MPGGYVSGRKFITDSEYQAAIEDAKLIEKLKANTDMNNPEAVRKLYVSLQSGEVRFKTIIGDDFDNQIYEIVNKKIKNNDNEKQPSKNKPSHKLLAKTKKKKDIKVAQNTKSPKINDSKKSDSIKINGTSIEEEAKLILKRRNRIRQIVMIAAAVIAIGSFGYFGIYWKIAAQSQAAYDELASLKGSEPITEEIEQKPLFTLGENEKMPEILDEYKNIYLKNKSIVGWLSIDDTTIDYPVMQTVNNDYYLKHDFEGKDDNNGALFVDCQCNVPFRSTNIIIYGHHMKSGKMFGNLKKYANEDYCKKHNIITFDTIYEKGEYEVMYVFKDNIRDAEDVSFKYYQFFDAVSEDEFYSNLKCMEEMSLFDTGVTATYGEDLLTLSTCGGSSATDRFVVVAKRVSGINKSKTYNVKE